MSTDISVMTPLRPSSHRYAISTGEAAAVRLALRPHDSKGWVALDIIAREGLAGRREGARYDLVVGGFRLAVCDARVVGYVYCTIINPLLMLSVGGRLKAREPVKDERPRGSISVHS